MLVNNWLTNWLPNSCLVNLIDVTLAFEDANSKLVEVDTAADVNDWLIDVTLAFEDANSKLVEVDTVSDVDDEDRIGNSLLQIWKLRFGRKA